MFDSPVLINTEVRSKAMADAMGTAPIVVLRQHGTVTLGRSIQEAVTRMVRAEKNADAQVRAITAGTPRFFAGSERAGLVAESGDGTHGIKKFWTYLEETADRKGRSSAWTRPAEKFGVSLVDTNIKFVLVSLMSNEKAGIWHDVALGQGRGDEAADPRVRVRVVHRADDGRFHARGYCRAS